MSFTLEELLTSPAGFGLTTPSPLQRAICRVTEGLPLGELVCDPTVIDAMGDVSALSGIRPREIDILSGVRTGKSRFAACLALHASQSVDVRHLAPGETPRVSVVSLTVDLGRVVFDHLAGTIAASPLLRKLVIDEPTADSVFVRHPCGRPVEIKVVAGARAGASLVARWSAGCVFDEFPRMVGSDDGAIVNFDDARRAVLGRLLTGAQITSVGSPWAPFGPAYNRAQEFWRKPSAELVVIKAPAPAMNPVWWTPARCEALKKSDETAYTTDVLAEFADPESAFITAGEIKVARRESPAVRPPRTVRQYIAAIDPGTRGNSWPLVILSARRDAENVARFEVVLATQWTGSRLHPLSPDAVFQAVARLVKPYGISTVISDQHSADAYIDLATRFDLQLAIKQITAQNRNGLFERMKGLFETGTIEIPPDPVFCGDLASIRRRLTATGLTYHLPRTADGRHADYAIALALAVSGFPDAPTSSAANSFVDRSVRVLRELAAREGYAELPEHVQDINARRAWQMEFRSTTETEK